MSKQEAALKERVIIAIGRAESEIASLRNSLGSQGDNALIVALATYDVQALESALRDKVLGGKVNGDTRFDIWGHGAVSNGEHQLASGANNQLIPTKNLFLKLREIVGATTPLTNVNLWACHAGAAANDVTALGAGSMLVSHAEEKFPYLNLNES